MMSGIGGMVVQGMAMGVGSAIGRRAVDGVMDSFSGSSAPDKKEAAAPAAAAVSVCVDDRKAFDQCMRETNYNVSHCDFYQNALTSCQQNAKM